MFTDGLHAPLTTPDYEQIQECFFGSSILFSLSEEAGPIGPGARDLMTPTVRYLAEKSSQFLLWDRFFLSSPHSYALPFSGRGLHMKLLE